MRLELNAHVHEFSTINIYQLKHGRIQNFGGIFLLIIQLRWCNNFDCGSFYLGPIDAVTHSTKKKCCVSREKRLA
jgi:hypothetical protein